MIPEFQIPEVTGFAFPNDIHITWNLMIVMYPYITGIVAGAFIISSLYHVFGKKELEPVNRFSLITSLAFLLFATLPLLNHLGHPERAFNIFFTPNFSSAIAGFGVLYNTYFLILLLEIWFVWRKDIILIARRSRGLKRFIYALLALGTYDISEEALKKDKNIVRILAAIGIPSACMLHGYVGFLFGALKSNPWWSTPLMPIIFLASGVTSGIAILIILYQIAMKVKGRVIDRGAISALASWLWLFMIITVSLELLEIITLAYERAEEWEVIHPLLTTKLAFSFISVQLIIGSLIPFVLLLIAVTMNRYLDDRVANTLSFTASLLLLLQVFAMRWNVVIGGQLISKSFMGYRSAYQPHLFEKEGILAAIVIFALPFIVLIILDRVLPIFDKMEPLPEGQES
jgi:Ni/Fe-hydrogenase subunit HybB-like protein